MIVYSVLWGDKYQPGYVYRLKRMVEKALPAGFRFVCVTDHDLEGVEYIRPKVDWPGWWQKVGLFHPDMPQETSLFFDLDVIVVGDLWPLVSEYKMAYLAAPDDWSQGCIASAFMIWNPPATAPIYEQFTPDVMERLHGDQNWIDEVFRDQATIIPPGHIVSYKWHVMQPRGNGEPPTGANVICFHGKPDPHEVAAFHPWIIAAWS